MSIVRNSACLTALVAALALAACGSQSGDGGDPCDFDKVEKGCVGLLNFQAAPQQIDGVTVPARTTANNLTSPGVRTVKVTDTSLNSVHSYQAVVNGQPPVNVACTVTTTGWVSVNPAVVLQQTGVLTCALW